MALKEKHLNDLLPAEKQPEAETIDTFHAGDFAVVQPKNKGYRSGLDALLLAAALPTKASGRVADLGAGSGVAGFAALNLHSELRLLSVERNSQMLEFSRRSIALQGNKQFRDRVQIIEADVTASGVARIKAGLEPDSVDYVLMNPPYNDSSARAPNDAMRAEAFLLGEGGIDAWFRTAASILRPSGMLAMIYRSENIGEVVACAQGRFGALEILPIHSKVEQPAKRIIVRGIRASRAPLSLLPGFIVHDKNSKFTENAEAIFNGETTL